MLEKHHRTYISHILLFVTGVVYMLDVIMGNKLSSLFTLNPAQIINNLEFWRIATFPYAMGSVEGALLFTFTFFIFAPKLEDIFHRMLYPWLILLVFCSQGIIFTLVFWKSTVSFAGMEGITFFVLTLFTFLHLKKKISFLYFRPFNTMIFLISVSAIWLLILTLHSVALHSNTYFLNRIYAATYGITGGSVVYLQIRLSKAFRESKKNIIDPLIDLPKPEELSLAVIANKELKHLNNTLNDDLFVNDSSSIFSEDKLNEILDKINSQGKESLSTLELKYLQDYSNNL